MEWAECGPSPQMQMFKSISTKQTYASSEWAAKLPLVDVTSTPAFGYVATLRYNKLQRDKDDCIASMREFIALYSQQVYHK